MQCVADGAAYPLPSHIINENYIANPGYINILAACIAIFGRAEAGIWLNVAMNCALLAVLRALAQRLCGRMTANLFVVLFCCIPSNTYIVGSYMSDLPCSLAAYAGLLLATRRNVSALAAAGVLLVTANYIRPVAMIFVTTAAVCLVLRGATRREWAALVLALAVTGGVIATANNQLTGRTFMFSTTGGCNAIMGANGTADGTYNDAVLREGREGDIPDSLGLDVFQKDSLLQTRAMEWAISHPAQFAMLAPRKLYMQFFADSYHSSLSTESGKDCIQPDGHMTPKYKRRVIAESLPYYMVLTLAACGIIMLLRRRKSRRLVILLAIPVAANIILAIATVGAPRYHYPIIPVFVLLAAIAARRSLKTL